MKKIFTLLLLSFFIISCSNDSSETSTDNTPIIENISNDTANIGDLITIFGQNFNPGITYTITVNGINAEIVSITSNSLSFTIPNGATTGQIILTVNGSTIVIGNITINSQSRLFAYNAYNGIVELNPLNGNEISSLVNTGSDYISEFQYLSSTNQLIGQKSYSDLNGNNLYKLVKINLSDNSVSEFDYNGYERLIVTQDSKLYGYKAYEGFIQINLDNGNEIGSLISTGADYISRIVYNSTTNEIFSQKTVSDINGNNTYYFYKINLSNNSISENTYLGYERLITTTTGRLFAYKAYEGIIELNNQTGAEIGGLVNTSTDYISKPVYFASSNEIIGQKSISGTGPNDTYNLIKLNLANNTITENSYTGYEYLIVVN